MKWLGEYAAAYGVEVACYCLMTSHIHLILIPSTQDAMQKLLKPLHMRYAGGFNRAWRQQRHIWGLLCGSEIFLKCIERLAGRALRCRTSDPNQITGTISDPGRRKLSPNSQLQGSQIDSLTVGRR